MIAHPNKHPNMKLTLQAFDRLCSVPEIGERLTVGLRLGDCKESLTGRCMKESEHKKVQSILERAEKCYNLLQDIKDPEAALNTVRTTLENALNLAVCNCRPDEEGVNPECVHSPSTAHCGASQRRAILAAIELLPPKKS